MRLLLISPLPVGPQMTAAGIRYTELARVLQARHDVVLAAPTGSIAVGEVKNLAVYDPGRPRSLRRLFAGMDGVFSQPLAPRLMKAATSGGRRWVADLLNPQPFEGLEYQKHRRRLERKALELIRIDRLAWTGRVATAFACGNERQRDMWLGFLAACRRLDTDLYEEDPELRALVDVVGSGVPDAPPAPAPKPVLRGPVFPEDARIMLWYGGIWNWFDPLTPIEALALLRRQDQRWVLAFGGTGVSTSGGTAQMVQCVRKRVRELRLDDSVHLPEGWVPYEQRNGWLLEADIGISTHRRTLEARYSFRNRLLEYLWAGLPILCSDGDELGDQVVARGWGLTVAPSDAAAFARAASSILERGRSSFSGPLREGAREHSWSSMGERLERLMVSGSQASTPGRITSLALYARHTAASLLRPG